MFDEEHEVVFHTRNEQDLKKVLCCPSFPFPSYMSHFHFLLQVRTPGVDKDIFVKIGVLSTNTDMNCRIQEARIFKNLYIYIKKFTNLFTDH